MKTHFLCSITFFRKSHRLWDKVDKFIGNQRPKVVTTWLIRVACWITRAICTYAYAQTHSLGYPHARTHARASIHTHRPIYNIYCFSTATMVSWTRLNVVLYVLLSLSKTRVSSRNFSCGREEIVSCQASQLQCPIKLEEVFSLCIVMINKSTEQSNWDSPTRQYIFRLLWKPSICCHVHKIVSLDFRLS